MRSEMLLISVFRLNLIYSQTYNCNLKYIGTYCDESKE